jgi:hypothetical protein
MLDINTISTLCNYYMRFQVRRILFCLFLSFPVLWQSVLAEGFSEQLVSKQAVDESTPGKGKAFFLSFVLPGAGEYYAGSKKWATVFAVSELTLWTTFTAFRIYGNGKRDDSRIFAAAHAGVNPSGKNDQYFIDIENFMSIVDYNDFKLQRRDLAALYPEDATYSWQWDSESSRAKYENLRVAKDRAYSRSMIVIAAVVLNHLVSGVDAIRVANQKSSLSEKNVQVGFIPLKGNGMVLAVSKRF